MKSRCFEKTPADETTAELEKGLMHGRFSFKADSESAKLMQPGKGTLDDPASLTQTAAVLSASTSDLRLDTPASETSTQAIGVVGSIGLESTGFAPRSASLAADTRDGLQQRLGLCHIMSVGLSQNGRKRDTLCVREDVVLAARTTAIGWVRSTFFPAPTERMDELSAMAREKSSLSAPRSSLSNTWCSRSQTRAFCHAFRRRQQVMPQPQPNSLGRSSQGMPVFKTKRIPVRACRSEMGFLPG